MPTVCATPTSSLLTLNIFSSSNLSITEKNSVPIPMVVPDPTKGDDVGKIKANVEGGQLRRLLNELHSDEEQ